MAHFYWPKSSNFRDFWKQFKAEQLGIVIKVKISNDNASVPCFIIWADCIKSFLARAEEMESEVHELEKGNIFERNKDNQKLGLRKILSNV